MQLRISDTFTDSLASLTGDEQKAVKTTAFDLQLNPANPGMKFHRLERARDSNFWSVRVSRDIRIIVHRSDASLLLCFVAHHDDAYRWAQRRKLETHPKTGAAQIVELRETVKEITVPVFVEEEVHVPSKPRVFTGIADDTLLGYGVPTEWLGDVISADEDSILEIADHLPAEAAEAVLELAVGGNPIPTAPPTEELNPFEHSDALRRFRVMSNVEELERAMEYAWDRWTVFLHPEQSELVTRDYSGPARVGGTAGTGKTVVALHRAVHMARQNPDARVLLATFNETLASALQTKVRRLIAGEPALAERLDVFSINEVTERLHSANFGRTELATRQEIRDLIVEASQAAGDHRFGTRFLESEWEQVVDAWQLDSWEDYRDVARLGRKTRLPESQRSFLWMIFSAVKEKLSEYGKLTEPMMAARVSAALSESARLPYDFAVIDEAQDISVAQLRLLAVLGGNRPNSLFFAGDLGQRIFQQPFSWKSLGVDIRGRSTTLRINYRTSHQIRRQADRLLGPESVDIDGNVEDRRGTISVFNGPNPEINESDSEENENSAVSEWVRSAIDDGFAPHEIGIFVRSEAEIERARQVAEDVGAEYTILDDRIDTVSGRLSLCTMHLAKGLEFRAVAVMACDDEVIPLQARIETVVDDSDLEEVYNTERQLLYVACTRARERLLVSGIEPISEFVEDMTE